MFGLVGLCLSTAYVVPHEEKSFVAHMRAHNLVYTGDEYQLRLGVFLSNSRFASEHNRAGHSFSLSLNGLATLTPAEYRARLNARPVARSSSASARKSADPPDSFDYRDQGAVTGVKDVGSCGGSWAFGAIAPQETAWKLTAGLLPILSEQNLIDCVTSCYGCDGGFFTAAYDYVIESQGGKFMLDSDYPYDGYDGTCRFDAAKGVTNLVGYYVVKSGDELDLQNAIWTKGAAVVTIDASSVSFELYTGGVYDDPTCSSSDLDHVVACVGWGVDGTTPYWIAKNCWGIAWGEQGYIRMIRNKNNQCGIATHAVVPIDK
jgi:cathepsin L